MSDGRRSGPDDPDSGATGAWWSAVLVALLVIIVGFAWYSNWPDNTGGHAPAASREVSHAAAPGNGTTHTARR